MLFPPLICPPLPRTCQPISSPNGPFCHWNPSLFRQSTVMYKLLSTHWLSESHTKCVVSIAIKCTLVSMVIYIYISFTNQQHTSQHVIYWSDVMIWHWVNYYIFRLTSDVEGNVIVWHASNFQIMLDLPCMGFVLTKLINYGGKLVYVGETVCVYSIWVKYIVVTFSFCV